MAPHNSTDHQSKFKIIPQKPSTKSLNFTEKQTKYNEFKKNIQINRN